MRLLRIGLLLLLPLLLVPDASAQATRSVDRTFDLTSDGAVELDTYKGTIDVKTWDRPTARVQVRIEGEQEPVKNTKIRFESSADRLEIETDYDEVENNQRFLGLFSFGSINRPATRYTLTLPETADVTIDTYSATTTMARVRGEVRFDAYSADFAGTRVGGSLHADTYSGRVEVGRTDDRVVVDTYSGELRVDSLYGRVDFSTYSGSATIGFATLNGDSRLDTFSGDVTATLPPGVGVTIEAAEDALNSDIPMQIEQISDDRLRATIGDGGPHIRFDTFSGTLSVRSR